MWEKVIILDVKAGKACPFTRFFDMLGNKNVLRKVSHD